MADTCGSCKHYIGGGDWNLCCDLKYDLCYRFSEACENYVYSEEKVQQLKELDKKIARIVKELQTQETLEAFHRANQQGNNTTSFR